jgi:hypothetical protein
MEREKCDIFQLATFENRMVMGYNMLSIMNQSSFTSFIGFLSTIDPHILMVKFHSTPISTRDVFPCHGAAPCQHVAAAARRGRRGRRGRPAERIAGKCDAGERRGWIFADGDIFVLLTLWLCQNSY